MASRSNNALLRPDLIGQAAMDGILAEVRLAAASVGRFSIGDDGIFEMEGVPFIFVALEGTCRVRIGDADTFALQPGDSIVSLRGDSILIGNGELTASPTHISNVWIQNAVPTATSEGYEFPVEVLWGDGDDRCRLLGSAMILSRTTNSLALIENCPPVLMVPASETRLDLMIGAFDKMLDDELQHPRRGFPAQSKAIAHLVLVQILRSYMTEHVPPSSELLATHRTLGVSRVLKRLRREPDRQWTMIEMAREAGMSRTSFFDHFCNVTGTTPFRYLAATRLDIASHLLKNSRLSIAEIIDTVGYKSSRAFGAAFKDRHQLTPSAFRRQYRE